MDTNTVPLEQICHILHKLNAVDRQRSTAFVKENDRIRFFAGRYLLDKYLHEFSISETLFQIQADAFKRPCLPETTFSISHSENWVAVAAGKKDISIGIDLEVYAPLCVEEYLEPFNEEEKEYILKENTLGRFYQAWTKKESALKGIGKGFLYNPLYINTKTDHFIYEKKKFKWSALDVAGNVISHICHDQDEITPRIKMIFAQL